MSNATIHEFDPLIYPSKLWIAISTENEFEGFEPLSEMNESHIAVTESAYDKVNDKGGVFIRFESRKSMTADIIAHEAFHAACNIFWYVGAKPDFENQEPLAYLIGWIAKCVDIVRQNKK